MGTECKLDQVDLKILSRLQGDGRLPNNQLAEAVGLSASPCLQRVRRLEKHGVIARYMAMLALDKLCRHVDVLAAVTLRNHAPEDFAQHGANVIAGPWPPPDFSQTLFVDVDYDDPIIHCSRHRQA